MTLSVLLCTQVTYADLHTLTNTEGKTVKVELVALEEEDTIVAKLGNRRIVNIKLDTLAEKDQAFLKTWWEDNKNKLGAMDVRLILDKKTDRIDREVKRSGGGGGGGNNRNQNTTQKVSKLTQDEFQFIGTLENYSRKDVSDVQIEYTIYKRVSIRDKDGSDTTVEEIDGTDTIRNLPPLGKGTFETEKILCEDSSESGGNQARTSKRETILGMVVRLRADGKQFLEQSYPENFIERLKEEEERE